MKRGCFVALSITEMGEMLHFVQHDQEGGQHESSVVILNRKRCHPEWHTKDPMVTQSANASANSA